MGDERNGPRASRRGFLKLAAGAGAAGVGLPVGRAASSEPPSAEEATGLFRSEEGRVLSELADLVLPGAGEWGAVDYIERLLTAFDHDPPRIHAGSAPGEWLPLDRGREHAWRLRLFGSEAVEHPNEGLVGPERGLRPLLLETAREAAARRADGADPDAVWDALSEEQRERLTELVLEASLGDPIYGGNRGGAAWRAFHFEGAMLGYGTFHPEHREHPRPARGEVGPDPLGPFTRAALWGLGLFSRWMT